MKAATDGRLSNDTSWPHRARWRPAQDDPELTAVGLSPASAVELGSTFQERCSLKIPGFAWHPSSQEVVKVMAEYPNRPHSIVWSSLAVQAGLAKLFELAYRFPSGNGAHITLGTLHRHYKEEGGVTQTIFHPDRSDLRSTLLSANASLVNPLGLAHEFMGMGEYEAEMRDLLLQWAVSRNELGLQ